MASTYTTRLRLEKPGNGEQSGTWGTTVNGTYDLLEIAVAGYLEIAMGDANVTLTSSNGASDQSRYHALKLTGTHTATRELIAPAVSKTYIIENATTQSVSVKTSSGTAVTIPTGITAYVFCDGTDFALGAAYDTTQLQILNSVTPAADRLLYFTSASTGALATFTSFGRSLVDDADASAGRTTLGLGSLATLSSINDSNWSGTDLAVGNGGTGASDAATARTNLGLVIGTNVQAYSANLASWSAVSPSSYSVTGADTTYAHRSNNLSDLSSASTARTNLGLGSLAVLSAINNSNWSGTALAVANGGTGATTAAAARSALGLEIGTNVQAFSDNLLAEAGLSASADKISYYTAAGAKALTGLSAFARSLLDDADAATARATLGVTDGGTALQAANNLSDLSNAATARTNLGLVIGTNVQAYSANLTTYAGIAPSANIQSFLGAADYAAMRTQLSLGTAALVNTGTSGATIPLLNGANTWGAEQRISGPYIGGSTSSYRGLSDTSGVYAAAGAILVWGGSGDEHTYLSARTGQSVIVRANGLSGTDLTVTSSALTWGGVAIPTISSADTLSNKTLSSPTLSGTVAGTPTWASAQRFPSNTGPKEANPYFGFFAADGSRNGYIQFLDGSSASIVNEETNGSINLVPNGTGVGQVGGVTIATASNTLTLSNKTLSNPTISGTVAGSPTASGTWTFSAAPIISMASPSIAIKDSDSAAGSTTGQISFTDSSSATVASVVLSADNWLFDFNYASADTIRFRMGSTPTEIMRLTRSTGVVNVVTALTVGGVAVPTISSTDTLTNKTISSPTLSGTVAGSPTFSGNLTMSSADMFFDFKETGATANEGNWRLAVNADAMGLYAYNDAANAFNALYNITRTAHTAATFDFGSIVTLTHNGVAIPTISSTSTLTNKTLSSPTLSGTVAGSPTFSGNPTFSGVVQLVSNMPDLRFNESDAASDEKIWWQYCQGGVHYLDIVNDGFTVNNRVWSIDRTAHTAATFDFGSIVTLTHNGVVIPTISSANVITNKQIRTPISSETSGSLTSTSANKTVQCTGGITLANSVFTAGDMIALDPGTSSITITRGSGVTMYVNGTNVASATLAANKMGGVFWRTASVCVLSGAIS